MFGFFFVIDAMFFAANTLKFLEGGWVPLVLGVALIALMTSWKRGRDLLLARWRQDSLPLAPFLARLPQSRTMRVPGMAVFLTGNPDYVPDVAAAQPQAQQGAARAGAVRHGAERRRTRGGRRAAHRGRRSWRQASIASCCATASWKARIFPRALEDLNARGIGFDPMQASYFLGREVLVPAMVPKMPWWRLWLFLVLARNAVPATEFFRIPSDRVVELGVRVAI